MGRIARSTLAQKKQFYHLCCWLPWEKWAQRGHGKGVVGLSFLREPQPQGYLLSCKPWSQILPGNAVAQWLASVRTLRFSWERGVGYLRMREYSLIFKENGQWFCFLVCFSFSFFFSLKVVPFQQLRPLLCVSSLIISVLWTSPSATSWKIPLCSQGQMLAQIMSRAAQLSEAAAYTM